MEVSIGKHAASVHSSFCTTSSPHFANYHPVLLAGGQVPRRQPFSRFCTKGGTLRGGCNYSLSSCCRSEAFLSRSYIRTNLPAIPLRGSRRLPGRLFLGHRIGPGHPRRLCGGFFEGVYIISVCLFVLFCCIAWAFGGPPSRRSSWPHWSQV